MATEIALDENGTAIISNSTDISSEAVFDMMSHQHPEMAAVSNWLLSQRRGQGGLFERDRYVTPTSIYQQMRVAQDAAENDDVVSGVLEATEAMAFTRIGFSCDEEDEEDIWCQVAEDLDLESRVREMWRETFTVSQFYGAIWWGRKDYTVGGKSTKGVKRKKTYSLQVPQGITILDPMKVVPVGNMMFNQETLCYAAERSESMMISDVLENRASDEMISTLMVKPYKAASQQERMLLGNLGVDPDHLWVMNPNNVWRHTATRSQYKRFADVRLKSVFEVLDLKHQLREMDRASLLGATNYIVLIKKGTDQHPGRQEEINALQGSVRTLARVPVIVGDHRLTVEIITPKTDHTLDPKRYQLLNDMIAARLYQTFITNSSSTGDDSMKLARSVARGMESRRSMLARTLEKRLLIPTFERNAALTSKPTLLFHPTSIALDFDAALMTYMLDLHQMGDISRETILNQIDLDQDQEFKYRKREKDKGYDDTFQSAVPFDAPANNSTPGSGAKKPAAQTKTKTADKPSGGGAASKTAGRAGGGNRKGGGAAPGTGQGKAKASDDEEGE